jgi:cell division septation protein DedD
MSYQLGADREQHTELYGEPRDEEARPRFRGLVATLIALLVMGVFAGGLWFAYTQGLRHASVGDAAAEVPLIRADERPIKVKPDNPGGMEIPDRDKLIYTQKRSAMEHLLPLPEKPMARPTASPPPIPVNLSETPPQPSASTAVPPLSPPQSATKPKPSESSAVPEKSTAARAVNAHGTRIQLGSVHSQDAARQEWDRIRRTNADLLGSVSAIPVRADLGEKGVFYRIQTAPVADAERICGELKRRNIGCIVAR